MSSAVLDRLGSLLEEGESNAQSSWLELVQLSADGGDEEEVLRRFRDSGRSRKELERDVAVLLDCRSLEATVAKIPELQMKEIELGQQFSAALRDKEAAEEAAKVAIQQAQEKLSKADAAHREAASQFRQARQAAQQLNDVKFHFLKGLEQTTAKGREISQEITRVQGQLKAKAAKIMASMVELARYESEWRDVDAWDEKTEVKNVERNRLRAGSEGTQNLIDRYSEDERDLQKQLLSLRKELAAEKSQLK